MLIAKVIYLEYGILAVYRYLKQHLVPEDEINRIIKQIVKK